MYAENTGFEEIETEWITLPDGTRLAARVWLPADARLRPVPAVLEFLPYRRRDVTAPRDESTYPEFARRGIAGVRVDMRGTGDSDGVFDDEYSETELSDAEAVIAWIAAQPWCSGEVGMMGISWGGFNALQVAARHPPALKAVISIASTVDRFADDIHYKGGCQLSAQLYWATTMLGKVARPPDSEVVGQGWRDVWKARLEAIEPLIIPWLSHQRRDAYWRHGSICEDFDGFTVPALLFAGWADAYRNTPWKAVSGLGPTAKAVTGPWIHKYPHFAFPHPRVDFHNEGGRWWERWLLGRENEADALPRHRLYVSENVRPFGWREREDGRWVALAPDAAQAPLRRHLRADGRLGTEPGPEATRIIRTPIDCGVDGGEYFTVNAGSDLPGDQRADDGMSTCFETEPLAEPVDVIGEPVVRLKVAIDTPIGNLVARLVDVHPDGVSHRVSLGVLNLAHRDGSATPRPMTPGQAEVVDLTLDVTGYRFRAGHRIRLALSTHYFPLILPPPTDVTATVDLGPGAWIDLPAPAVEEIDMPPPLDPDPIPAYERNAPAIDRRTVTRDAATGQTTVMVEADSGETLHPDNGMRWQDIRQSEWSITRADPLSLEGLERMIARRVRDGIETECIATGRLTVTATHWHVEATLTAREGDTVFFSRDWRAEIPRDHM